MSISFRLDAKGYEDIEVDDDLDCILLS